MGTEHGVLSGRVAVITGSTRGLGFAMAQLLGRHGATVVVASRWDADVAAAVERLGADGIAAVGRGCDTGEWADVEALRDLALAQGTLDIWVNNAGTSGVYGPTASTPVEDFAGVVRTNILGTFHGSRVALPVFLDQGHGDLVNVYGRGDQGPVPLQNAYASSKRWVRQFTETGADTRRSGPAVARPGHLGRGGVPRPAEGDHGDARRPQRPRWTPPPPEPDAAGRHRPRPEDPGPWGERGLTRVTRWVDPLTAEPTGRTP